MIVGHFGLAAGMRGGWPRASLLWLLPASIAPDLLDLLMAAAGICNPYGLYSHTLPAVALLAAVVGGMAYLTALHLGAGTAAVPTAIACVLVVALHPALDFLTGYKLFWPGGTLLGMRLYERPLVDFLLESAIVIAGWLVLRRSPAVPRWAATPVAVCALVVLQAAAGFGLRGLNLKPNACVAEAGPAL